LPERAPLNRALLQRGTDEHEGEMRRSASAYFFSSASGSCTASLPLLSLRTRYCGSSFEARTFRFAAVASEVIFSSTVPSAVLPWVCQVTLVARVEFVGAHGRGVPAALISEP
jgi:hypothetical protein